MVVVEYIGATEIRLSQLRAIPELAEFVRKNSLYADKVKIEVVLKPRQDQFNIAGWDLT